MLTCFIPPSVLQVSQHPQATVWNLFRTTILPTGSSPYRPSQRWTSPPAPQCPLSPLTTHPSVPRCPSTEPAGPPTRPQPRPTPPASSTHLPQASSRPSDPQPSPPQTSSTALPWTATRDCETEINTLFFTVRKLIKHSKPNQYKNTKLLK